MAKSDYESYAILEAQIEALTEQKDAYKAKIIEDMMARGDKNADTAVGKFTVAELKNWTYSPTFEKTSSKIKDSIAELNDEIKALKAREEEDGIATCEIKPSLRFTPVKL